MRQHSASVALWGTSAVRMAWGSIQEASALYCLMQLFPDSLMEEAGLFQLGGRCAGHTSGNPVSADASSSSAASNPGSAQGSAAGTGGGSSPAPAEVPLPVQLLQLKRPARPAAATAAADQPDTASSWLLEALGLPLPALGASPDGLIHHTVRLPLWEVQMALQRATNCRWGACKASQCSALMLIEGDSSKICHAGVLAAWLLLQAPDIAIK
jgi:hypothetical protein